MKKITFSCLVFFFISHLNAQSFEKGSMNFDIGVGFSVFGTSQEMTTKVFINQNLVDEQKSDTTDGAVAVTIPISFEYGISNKFGLGVDFVFSNYIIADEDKPNINSAKAIDFGIKANYHLLNSDKNDLFVGLGLGFSSITWDLVTDNPGQTAEEFSGSGAYWRIGVTDRIFFSEHIGVFFSLAYKGYAYDIDTEFTDEAIASFNSLNASIKQSFTFDMNGVDAQVGLAVKF